jgi:glycosyltransferase involved in cell wall biosynthesis
VTEDELRVLHLGKYYPPHHGGMETYLHGLLQALAPLGVKAIALVHRSTHGARSVEDNASSHRIVRAAVWFTMLFAPLSPAFPWQLQRLIREEAPELLHIHMPNLSAFWALLLPSARKLPWVVHWHADIPLSTQSLALRWVYRALYRPLERQLLQRAAVIIATSPPYLKSSPSLQLFRDKVSVVPLGLQPPVVVGDSQTDTASSRPLRLIAIGRLTYYKGFANLLHALGQCPGVTLDLIGDGSERPVLAALAAAAGLGDRVTLHGALADEAVQRLLARADVLCLPSVERTEAFGMVLLEAMARGKACIATNVPGSGMPWVVQHEVTGLVVPPENIDALAQAIARLAANPMQMLRLGAAGKARFNELFQIEHSADAIIRIYRSLASTKQ